MRIRHIIIGLGDRQIDMDQADVLRAQIEERHCHDTDDLSVTFLTGMSGGITWLSDDNDL